MRAVSRDSATDGRGGRADRIEQREWGRGQHEVNFIYTEPVQMADMHVIFKQGVKELAAQHGKAVTFMAKPSMSEPGSSCHIHTSLWSAGKNLFWDNKRETGSKLFRQFLGGLMKYSRELSYFFAPTINAYSGTRRVVGRRRKWHGRMTIGRWVFAW